MKKILTIVLFANLILCCSFNVVERKVKNNEEIHLLKEKLSYDQLTGLYIAEHYGTHVLNQEIFFNNDSTFAFKRKEQLASYLREYSIKGNYVLDDDRIALSYSEIEYTMKKLSDDEIIINSTLKSNDKLYKEILNRSFLKDSLLFIRSLENYILLVPSYYSSDDFPFAIEKKEVYGHYYFNFPIFVKIH